MFIRGESMFSLAGKVAIITGGGSGIGLATVRRFHEAGAKVVIADVTDQTKLAQELNGLYVQTDVAAEEEVKNLMKRTYEEFGNIDILINNAGIMTEAPIIETTKEDMMQNFQVNTLGVLYGMKHAIKYMKKGGAIVNTASTAGVRGVPNYAAYAASKWAIIGITKVAALEFGPNNVRVNCVCPSSVETPLLASQEGGELEKLIVSTGAPLGKISKPEDVASLIHFLVADDCPMVSGQAINIDGGSTAGHSIAMMEAVFQGVVNKL